MSNDPEATNPPNTPRNAFRWLWKWSQTHQIAAAIIGGLLCGWILGKVL